MPDVVVDALLADESRPRCMAVDDGVLLNMRGVNMDPGADPADMLSIQIWGERQLIVSTQRQWLRAVNDVESTCMTAPVPKMSANCWRISRIV